MEIPAEWQPILEYMEKYPRFAFRSSRLSLCLSKDGIEMSPQRISKLLREMYANGILERFTRGKGTVLRTFYKIRK